MEKSSNGDEELYRSKSNLTKTNYIPVLKAKAFRRDEELADHIPEETPEVIIRLLTIRPGTRTTSQILINRERGDQSGTRPGRQ